MPHYRDIQHSSYTPSQLFDLVADVEKYPEFLPWCRAARILSRENGKVFLAELVIAYKQFSERYTSRVELYPGESDTSEQRIHVTMVRGPFHHLTNDWRFVLNGQGGTDIHFDLDFAFRSKILDALLGKFFSAAASKMAESFKKRADALYGKKK